MFIKKHFNNYPLRNVTFALRCVKFLLQLCTSPNMVKIGLTHRLVEYVLMYSYVDSKYVCLQMSSMCCYCSTRHCALNNQNIHCAAGTLYVVILYWQKSHHCSKVCQSLFVIHLQIVCLTPTRLAGQLFCTKVGKIRTHELFLQLISHTYQHWHIIIRSNSRHCYCIYN